MIRPKTLPLIFPAAFEWRRWQCDPSGLVISRSWRLNSTSNNTLCFFLLVHVSTPVAFQFQRIPGLCCFRDQTGLPSCLSDKAAVLLAPSGRSRFDPVFQPTLYLPDRPHSHILAFSLSLATRILASNDLDIGSQNPFPPLCLRKFPPYRFLPTQLEDCFHRQPLDPSAAALRTFAPPFRPALSFSLSGPLPHRFQR